MEPLQPPNITLSTSQMGAEAEGWELGMSRREEEDVLVVCPDCLREAYSLVARRVEGKTGAGEGAGGAINVRLADWARRCRALGNAALWKEWLWVAHCWREGEIGLGPLRTMWTSLCAFSGTTSTAGLNSPFHSHGLSKKQRIMEGCNYREQSETSLCFGQQN